MDGNTKHDGICYCGFISNSPHAFGITGCKYGNKVSKMSIDRSEEIVVLKQRVKSLSAEVVSLKTANENLKYSLEVAKQKPGTAIVLKRPFQYPVSDINDGHHL